MLRLSELSRLYQQQCHGREPVGYNSEIVSITINPISSCMHWNAAKLWLCSKMFWQICLPWYSGKIPHGQIGGKIAAFTPLHWTSNVLKCSMHYWVDWLFRHAWKSMLYMQWLNPGKTMKKLTSRADMPPSIIWGKVPHGQNRMRG